MCVLNEQFLRLNAPWAEDFKLDPDEEAEEEEEQEDRLADEEAGWTTDNEYVSVRVCLMSDEGKLLLIIIRNKLDIFR